MLAGEAQRSPARRQDPQPRAARQQVGDQRRGLKQMLEVVEDQQRAPGAKVARDGLDRPLLARLLEPERLGEPPATSVWSPSGASETNVTPPG